MSMGLVKAVGPWHFRLQFGTVTCLTTFVQWWYVVGRLMLLIRCMMCVKEMTSKSRDINVIRRKSKTGWGGAVGGAGDTSTEYLGSKPLPYVRR